MSQTASPRHSGPLRHAVLIAGPTASGKSRMALDHAGRLGGIIVNADSMQVYRQLRVLTARPSAQEEATAPHFLYGHVDGSSQYSTGAWLADVAALLSSPAAEGRRCIFVGGTGLYFKALTEGISRMPDIPARTRKFWRDRLEREGPQALHRLLAARDGEMAGRLEPADGQRIVRALEVLDVSGRSLADWQRERGDPLVDAASAEKIVLSPERAILRQRIDSRFDAMVEAGALEEVRRLLAGGPDGAMPVMKAIGVRELADHIRGKLTLDEAIARAKIATRQYAKRQDTWFRNQMPDDWKRLYLAS